MPFIQANGIQIYYELHGPGEGDVLVLSNGVLMSTASWAYQTPVLSQHTRLLLYDCRGMWLSDHPPGPYTMALHADDLAALLDALDIQQAHIGGASYGAEISMVFALNYPERTRSLIITSAVSQVDPVLGGMIDSWTAAARMKDPELFFRLVYPVTFSDWWITANRPILDQARERYKTLDYGALVTLFECFSELDITADLNRITAPSLVAVGEEDILKPRKYSEIIARQITGSELAIIPHAGHAAMWEQPAVFNSLVLGFLAKHHSRGVDR